MLFYANGCSMTLGMELTNPDKDSFAAIVADHYGAELVNSAYNGASNCRILRTTLTWIAQYIRGGGDPGELFVLIGWTAPDRREFGLSDEEGTADANLFWRDLFLHCRLEGVSPDVARMHKLMFPAFSSDRESMTRFLVAANSVQGTLKRHSIRFCFVHAMPTCTVHPELTPLVNSIDAKRFLGFMEPEADFLSMSRDIWRVPLGSMYHPLEEGHRRWSRLVIDQIDRMHLP